MNTLALRYRFLTCVLLWFFFVLITSSINAWAGDSSSAIEMINVPKEGTAAERTRTLWHTIRPIILSDAKSPLTDAEYLDKRNQLASAWQQLDWDVAEHSSEEVSQFSRRVWMLIGDLYGVASTRPDYRQKVRQRTKAKIDNKLQELDETAKSLR